MSVIFSGSAVSALASDLINSAAIECAVLAPGESLETVIQTWCLEKLQRLIDQWNAIEELIFSVAFQQYTLQANHAPHTIGPTGDFNTGPAASYRPVRLGPGCSFILNASGANPTDMPIRLRDKDWWGSNPLKSQTSSIVTDVYYDPASPNGNLNFWPICNVANPVRLELWNSLAQPLTVNAGIGMVQGYWEAIVLTLARDVAAGFGPDAVALVSSAAFTARHSAAMRVITANNESSPRIDCTQGMPGSANVGRPDYNFLTGLRE